MLQLERTARAIAMLLVAWLLWASLRPASATRVERVRAREIDARGAALARDGGVIEVHAVLDSSPSRSALDLLAAMRRAGVDASWEGDVPALAVDVAPIADPRGGTRVAVAAPAGTRTIVADAGGPLDTLAVGAGRAGAELVAPLLRAPVSATAGAFAAASVGRDSLQLRPVLVIGTAGWESKFVIAALEERGWRVATRLALGPGTTVDQGAVAPIDTARFAAVVALDSSAASSGGALRRYVHSGGGLVLAGRSASGSGMLGSLAPARVGRLIPTRPALVADSLSPATVTRVELAAVRAQGVVLSRHDGEIVVAARREGAGRVVQVGVEESWRWRMEGAPGSEEAHRRWWSQLVSSVAYAPVVPVGRRSSNDASNALPGVSFTSSPVVAGEMPPAPLASVVRALGPASDARASSPSFDPLGHLWVLAASIGFLLVEWYARRLRGAR